MTDRAALSDWVTRYERLWRTPGTARLGDLFADDITYSPSPWREPTVGLTALQAFWESERDGPGEGFSLRAEVVAVDGEVGVVRVEVAYDAGSRWRDLWIVALGPDGRCRRFEEWPFAPTQPDGH